MKIIDLIELLISGKAMPRHIIFEEENYYWVSSANDYICSDHDATQLFNNQYNMSNLPLFLGKRVEILEEENKDNFTGWKMYQDGKEVCSMDCSVEEKKIPEKFKVHSLGDKHENGNFVSSPFPTDEEFMNKINDIIDYLDYLKSKGDE